MTDRQLLLDLAGTHRFGRADFLPSESNAAGLAAVDGWRAWPTGQMLLVGPEGSGRSHLGAIWAAESGAQALRVEDLPEPPPDAPAYLLDDADRVAGDPAAETVLFHLINHARARGRACLLTARETPGTWRLGLPDLESRLLAMPVARLRRPDDALLRMVLVKLCDDRQLVVGAEVIAYLAARIDRSLADARAVVADLDRAALTRQKRVSRALAGEVLAARAAAPERTSP